MYRLLKKRRKNEEEKERTTDQRGCAEKRRKIDASLMYAELTKTKGNWWGRVEREGTIEQRMNN